MDEEESKEEEKEDFFQVEKIVDMKTVKGRLIFLLEQYSFFAPFDFYTKERLLYTYSNILI